MADHVIFTRDEGGYTLSVGEREHLEVLVNVLEEKLADPEQRFELGLGQPIYTFILSVLSEEYEIVDPATGEILSGRQPKAGVAEGALA